MMGIGRMLMQASRLPKPTIHNGRAGEHLRATSCREQHFPQHDRLRAVGEVLGQLM